MTSSEAKEILMLYRPGTADATDPTFTEALALCERDEELKNWLARHCALYTALRSKFKQIAVPPGLKEQIIAERQVHVVPIWQKAVLAVGAVAAVVMVILAVLPSFQARERHDFAAYRDYMGSLAERGYYMDTNTSNLNQIRSFLAQKQAIADYVLPENLQKNARPAGCLATTWQGKPVSMICFQTGRPMQAPRVSDLWLFISDQTIASGAPKASTPTIEKANGMITASWTVGNRTYVLATEGDASLLSKFL
jgi:hypothetical protein